MYICVSKLKCTFLSTDKRKVADARVGKEMMKLQKESRNRDHKIKTLESDARRRELVLKRRQEEVKCIEVYIHLYMSTPMYIVCGTVDL